MLVKEAKAWTQERPFLVHYMIKWGEDSVYGRKGNKTKKKDRKQDREKPFIQC
jgi:hypothetical protein